MKDDWLILIGSMKGSGKMPTYPSPKPTLTLPSHLKHNVSLGVGGTLPET